MNDDYTSKLFSRCNEVLEPTRDKRSKPIHAVRRCLTTSYVLRVWHRNVNAGRNIFAVFPYENSHRAQRPEKFTRTYQRDTLCIR